MEHLVKDGLKLGFGMMRLPRNNDKIDIEKTKEMVDAFMAAEALANTTMDLPVPIWLRNAPTKLMKDLGFGKGQKWEAGFHLEKNYLPDEIKDVKIS